MPITTTQCVCHMPCVPTKRNVHINFDMQGTTSLIRNNTLYVERNSVSYNISFGPTTHIDHATSRHTNFQRYIHLKAEEDNTAAVAENNLQAGQNHTVASWIRILTAHSQGKCECAATSPTTLQTRDTVYEKSPICCRDSDEEITPIPVARTKALTPPQASKCPALPAYNAPQLNKPIHQVFTTCYRKG